MEASATHIITIYGFKLMLVDTMQRKNIGQNNSWNQYWADSQAGPNYQPIDWERVSLPNNKSLERTPLQAPDTFEARSNANGLLRL